MILVKNEILTEAQILRKTVRIQIKKKSRKNNRQNHQTSEICITI